MSRIEAGLHAYHESAGENEVSDATDPSPSTVPSESRNQAILGTVEASFAKVNSVVAGSPADEAGLKPGDSIRQFGNVNWTNHENLSKVAETVQRNEGVGA